MRKILSDAVRALVAVLCISAASPAAAATINWTLSGVLFEDGGSASGTFSIDSATGAVTAFNVSTTTTGFMSGATYEPTTSITARDIYTPNSVGFALISDDGTYAYHFIILQFANALTSAGLNALVFGDYYEGQGSWECQDACARARAASSGFAVGAEAVATPIPPALPLFAAGLAGLGWLAGRQRRKRIRSKATSHG